VKVAAIVPAFDAARSVAAVVTDLLAHWGEPTSVFVVDDGSSDGTAAAVAEMGVVVLRHDVNQGKGAALRTGMRAATEAGFTAAVTVDADGQHPADEAWRLAQLGCDPDALVLGTRDLVAAGAPRPNRISNGISNGFLSAFSRKRLADTQCGLRRYPLPRALTLGGSDDGYAFEAEVILLAIAAGVPIVQLPVTVLYPADRTTHFDSVRDPARVIRRVLRTLLRTRGVTRAARRAGP
jgi:glycosyltransferase involved in cell wall biosynthesis